MTQPAPAPVPALVPAPVSALAAAVRGLPDPVDAIVGVPRGGLLVAALLGYRLGIKDVAAAAFTYTRPAHDQPPADVRIRCLPAYAEPRRILVVEDAAVSFTLGGLARDHLVAAGHTVVTAAVSVTPESVKPDIWISEGPTIPTADELQTMLAEEILAVDRIR